MNSRYKPATKIRIREELLCIGTIGLVDLEDRAEGSANFHACLAVQGNSVFIRFQCSKRKVQRWLSTEPSDSWSAFEDVIPGGFHLPHSNTSLSYPYTRLASGLVPNITL